MTYDEFDQKVRARVEEVKPGTLRIDVWQYGDRYAKLTPEGETPILWAGLGSVIIDGQPGIAWQLRQDFSLNEESAEQAARIVIDSLNGDLHKWMT